MDFDSLIRPKAFFVVTRPHHEALSFARDGKISACCTRRLHDKCVCV